MKIEPNKTDSTVVRVNSPSSICGPPKPSGDASAKRIYVVGVEIPTKLLFLFYGLMFFAFMFLHDFLQEHLLKIYGRREAGPFLALFDCLGCFVGPLLFDSSFRSNMFKSRKESRYIFVILTFLVYGSILASNLSLSSVSFPLKVVMKSCKLIPTMIVAALVHKKAYQLLDYFYATMICAGLAGFTLAEYHVSKVSSSVGGIFLCFISITFDSIAPNLQDKLMSKEGFSVMEVMGWTNFYCSVVASLVFASSYNPTATISIFLYSGISSFVFTLFYGVSTFCGVQAYMKLLKHSGAVGAVAVSTFRKIVTITMSFLFFPKPFSKWYIASSIMVFGPIVVRACSKRTESNSK